MEIKQNKNDHSVRIAPKGVTHMLPPRSPFCIVSSIIYLLSFCVMDIVSNFRPFEVVGRGSETQLQVGENLSKITEREPG